MSHTEQLSRQRKGTVINQSAKDQDPQLRRCMLKVARKLERDYGLHGVIEHKTKLDDLEVIQKLKKSVSYDLFESTNTRTHIRPDGGFLYISHNDENFYLATCEAKKQGTNDKRLAEGKEIQARGNAIERLFKNINCFSNVVAEENIFPFAAFCIGDDGCEDSTIPNRLVQGNHFAPNNEIHCVKVRKGNSIVPLASIFWKESYTDKFIYNTMYTIAERSLLYYFEKYEGFGEVL